MECCLIKIAAVLLIISLKLFKIFALRMARTALCRPNCIDATRFRAVYGELSAVLFAIFKVIFTNKQIFLLNKSWRTKVCRTLLIHWLVYFISKRSSSRRANCRKFFHCIDPQPCMGMER